jgi:hypothetical protein
LEPLAGVAEMADRSLNENLLTEGGADPEPADYLMATAYYYHRAIIWRLEARRSEFNWCAKQARRYEAVARRVEWARQMRRKLTDVDPAPNSRPYASPST